MTKIVATIAATLGLLLALQAPARAADEAGDDMRARTHFAAGEYKQALDIYARLYAETLHPTYLRNIARCYQNLGEADKAISSFREYLRKAKDLTPQQRAEIDGYIAEMEQLKRSHAASPPAASAPPTSPSPSPSGSASPTAPMPAPVPAAPRPQPPAEGSLPLLGPSTIVAQPKREGDGDGETPIYKRGWFWGAVAGVAAAGIVTALLLSGDPDRPRGSLGALDLTDKK